MIKKIAILCLFILPLVAQQNIAMTGFRHGDMVSISLLSEPSEDSRTASLSWDTDELALKTYSFAGNAMSAGDEPLIDDGNIRFVLPTDDFLDMSLSFQLLDDEDCASLSLSLIQGLMKGTKEPGIISHFSEDMEICLWDTLGISTEEYIAASPNPFNSTVELVPPFAGNVEIYSQQGRLIRKLGHVDGSLSWNGTADDGTSLASGVYYITVEAEGKKGIGRVMFIK